MYQSLFDARQNHSNKPALPAEADGRNRSSAFPEQSPLRTLNQK
jgi:hypothetical protein